VENKNTSPGRPVLLMGILNLTEDSFFPGSRYLSEGQADTGALVRAAGAMLSQGAAILDIGACSTRPGAAPVGAEEEWRRLEKGLAALRESFPNVPISIDTTRAETARRAAGTADRIWINDISAGEDDPDMLRTVAELGLPYIAMHKRGTPATMQSLTDYPEDPSRPGRSPVTAAVLRYFEEFSLRAAEAGIRDWILDPGFGFAKTVRQNWQLLRELPAFRETGRKILVGVSRKSFLYKPLGISPEEALTATQVAHLAALQGGADLLRVHDVAAAAQTVQLYRLLTENNNQEI